MLCATAGAAVEVRQGPEGVRLANGAVELMVSADGTVSAGAIRDGKAVPMLSAGRSLLLVGMQDKRTSLAKPVAKVVDVKDNLGAGKAVETSYSLPDGQVRAVYALYDEGEFFTSELHFIATDKPFVVREAEVLQGRLDLGAGEVRVLRNEGMWSTKVKVLADKTGKSTFASTAYNRQTRQGAVLGALSADAASEITTSQQGGAVEFAMIASYGDKKRNLQIEPGKTVRTGPFAVFIPRQIFAGLEAYGAAVKHYNNIKLYRPIPCGWCSWDCLSWHMVEKQVYDTIDVIRTKRLAEYGFNVMQIDDGWQRGWRCSGDWEFNVTRFPHGIRPFADQLRGLGVTLGLWIGPFSDEDAHASAGPSGEVKAGGPGWMAAARPVLDNYPEFQVGNKNGKPGGPYDLSLPAFKKHLTGILERLTKEYGAGYIKADFLTGHGIADDKTTPRHDVYRNALKAMRAGMAPNTYFMTCIAPEWKSVGIADGQRIGNDVQWSWKGLYPTARCAPGWYYCNGNFWWNDPDQLHVTGGLNKEGKMQGLTFEQAQAWATLVALYGGVTMTGDNLNMNEARRMKLFTQCLPSTGRTARPLDLFDVITEQSPEIFAGIWALKVAKPFGDYHLLGVFNWTTDAPQERKINLAEVGCGVADNLLVYDYWAGKLLPAQKGNSVLAVSVPPTSVRLLVLHKATGRPQFVASDRHIVTGDVDVAEVRSQGDALSGKSEALVSGVPFRYTFYVPDGQKVIEAVFDGQPAKVEMAGDNLAVVEFTPSKAKIDWSLRFGRR